MNELIIEKERELKESENEDNKKWKRNEGIIKRKKKIKL